MTDRTVTWKDVRAFEDSGHEDCETCEFNWPNDGCVLGRGFLSVEYPEDCQVSFHMDEAA